MITKIRQLFCKHDYKRVTPDLTGYIRVKGGGSIGFECRKCGKFIMR